LRVHTRIRQLFWSNAVAACISLTLGFATMARFGAFGVIVSSITAELVRMALMTRFLARPDIVADEADRAAAVVGASQSPAVLELRQ
jgi:hypothetical protein